MKQLKAFAATLTNMEPAQALVTLRGQSNPIESAKLLYYMEISDSIFEELDSAMNDGKAGEIIYRQVQLGYPCQL